MVTDTVPFRYPYYHTPADTPDQVNYECTVWILAGLEGIVADLTEVVE